MPNITFTPDQVKALLGGKFPYANGFAWNCVRHFELTNGMLEPYDGDEILPAPGFHINIEMDSGFFNWGK